MRCLITGTAGFVGFHLARRLLSAGHTVVGIDAMTPYYDVTLKERRHAILAENPNFSAHQTLLEDGEKISEIVAGFKPDAIVHLAAQAGVRYSLENPKAYISANIVGTHNIVESCRHTPVRHLMMASTSSVYGANTKLPFAEKDPTDHPLTLYAASKKATEVIGHSYSHLWKIPTTMFRFFTVYGPWGRPDMALFKFVKAALEGNPIDVYNNGNMSRDFTYIDDLVEAITHLIDKAPQEGKPVSSADTLSPVAPFRIVNIGGGNPVELMAFIQEIEKALDRKIIRNFMEMQQGDVPSTTASADLLEALIGFRPETPVSIGVPAFIRWYLDYYSADGSQA